MSKKSKSVQPHNYKLSDEQFFSILRENAGLFARTARAIKQQFGIKYTRQAVRKRALASPEILKDIEEENLDIAEEGLHTLMRSQNERIKLKAIELFLKTKGKKRGYVERQEMYHEANEAQPEEIEWRILTVKEIGNGETDHFEDAETEEE